MEIVTKFNVGDTVQTIGGGVKFTIERISVHIDYNNHIPRIYYNDTQYCILEFELELVENETNPNFSEQMSNATLDNWKLPTSLIEDTPVAILPGNFYKTPTGILHNKSDTTMYVGSKAGNWDWVVPKSLVEDVPTNTVKIMPGDSYCNHEYVNVGFTSLKLACKHCGVDK